MNAIGDIRTRQEM